MKPQTARRFAVAAVLSVSFHWTPPLAASDSLLGLPPATGCGIDSSCPNSPGGPSGTLCEVLGTCGTPAPVRCINNNTGATCGADSGPASQAPDSGQNVGAGNPLSLLSGNKYQQETDLPALPGVLGLEIVRHYNSLRSRAGQHSGALGRGWRLSYDTRLYTTRVNHQIVQADGTRVVFSRDPAQPSVCASADPARGVLLVARMARGEQYVWVWPDGRKLYFDTSGNLTQILAPTGEFVSLQHDADGNLVKVTDPQGRSLVFSYLKGGAFAGIEHIDSPVGRFSYHYGSAPADPAVAEAALAAANLTKVTLPTHYDPADKPHAFANRGVSASTLAREYHYEDARFPTFLTGITVSGAGSDEHTVHQRISTYVYDGDARAVRSVRGPLPPDGERGPDDVSLDFSTPGQTVLTNSLGRTTTYLTTRIGSERRILEARGPGCATCGHTNVRYRYDARGRLTATTTLDARGRALISTQTELDAASRPLRTARFDFSVTPPRLIGQVRYAYASPPATSVPTDATDPDTFMLPAPQPILIARPSVVAGREHQLRLEYNAAGQVLAVTETGFSPALPVSDADAAGNGPVALSRTTTYRYARINGRSVLVEIDGPLPNGPLNAPEDSDITRTGWDGAGNHPLDIVRPGGFRQRLAYDARGRIASITDDDGQRRIVTSTRYSGMAFIALQPESVVQEGWRLENGQPVASSRLQLALLRAQYDAFGRRTLATDAAGRSVELAYDGGGRLVAVTDDSGYQSRLDLDGEGRIERAALYRPGQDTVPWRAAYYWRDEAGRQTARLLPDGRLDTWRYDEAGRLTEHIDGDEIRTRYLQRADHRLGVRIARTPDGSLRFNPNTSEDLLIDDFGHVLRQVLPDHGTKTARYDAAGRIVDIASADGSRTAYTYDAAGRLIRKDLYDAQGQTAEAVALTYAGHTLARRRDGVQISRLGYDALGRKTQEAISLSGLDQVFTTHTRFDPDSGLVSARVLADGRVLRIARTDARHGASVRSLRLQAAWAAAVEDWLSENVARGLGEIVGRWLPDTTIADQISIDPFDGLSAYTAGNGIVTRRSYDTAGRLTVLDIDGIDRTDYRYGNGPRIKSIDSPLLKADYRYTGFGQLQPDPPNEPTPARREARHPANTAGTAVTRDALGRTVEDTRFRYTYTASGQVDTVTDRTTGQPVARYRYNSLGQRVVKTVIAQGRDATTWTLWLDGKRVAELDASGAIQTQYLYLSESERTTPVARLDGATTYFIHTDHRGAPIAMTDERKAIVWRATLTPRGLAMPQGARASSPPAPTEAVVTLSHFGVVPLNLRLPGQYFDAETGLHDNWHRTYDPRTGRYLQPDPMGYPDGPDAYLYAAGDPVNRGDPMGLYAIDVHYYMTYFLALVAGIDQRQAWVIATAAQTIDDVNPYTDAMPFKGAGWAYEQRQKYHFTQNGFDPPASANDVHEEIVGYTQIGMPIFESTYSPEYQLRRLKAWNNPQVRLLHDYAIKAGDDYGPCMKGQFYGEYLHALADVFGHRDANNDPYGAVAGHWYNGTDPDTTYNHGVWQFNEQRTLEMERTMFEQLQNDFGRQATDKDGFPIRFSDIEGFLKDWNHMRSDSKKITELSSKIRSLGLLGPADEYDGPKGLACRFKFLRSAFLINAGGVKTNDGRLQFPGAILDTPVSGGASCPY